MGTKLIDLTGNRYGKLVVTSHAGVRGRRSHFWKCKCDCGSIHEASGDNLKKGGTKSCGKCYSGGEKNKTHGLTGTTTYNVWMAMKARCGNPNHEKYPCYGGRGISVCDKWANSFSAFLEDMGERPAGKSIDRINVHGDYEPSNCRWASHSEQMRNTTTNRSLDRKSVV